MTPSDLFAGLTVDGTGITIPYTDLAGLTQADADPTTGSGGQLGLKLATALYEAFVAVPVESRPTKFSVTAANPTGVGVNEVRRAFTISANVILDTDVEDIAPEP